MKSVIFFMLLGLSLFNEGQPTVIREDFEEYRQIPNDLNDCLNKDTEVPSYMESLRNLIIASLTMWTELENEMEQVIEDAYPDISQAEEAFPAENVVVCAQEKENCPKKVCDKLSLLEDAYPDISQAEEAFPAENVVICS